MRRVAFAALVLALAACGQSTTPTRPEIPPTELVTPEGYAGVRIGMTLEEAQAAVGAPLDLHEPLDDPNACRTFSLTADEYAPSFMAEDNRVTRVSFFAPEPRARTAEDIGIGSTVADVRAAYPNAVREPAPYDEAPAHDLIVWTAPDRAGYRFEISQDGVVRIMHAGTDSILYIEGCA